VSADFILAALLLTFGCISFFTMLHLMGTGHTKHERALRNFHRFSELLTIAVFAAIVIGEIADLAESGLSTRGIILATLAAILIPLFIIKNLISEKYPELRNRLISIGTTVLVGVFVLAAAVAIFHYVEFTGHAAGAGGIGEPEADLALGRELFVAKCSKCHRLDAALSGTHTPEEWRRTVERMRLKDPAWISESQAAVITAFLISVGGAR
jgi:hypothetical protein